MSAQYSSHVTQEDLFDLAAYRHVDTCPNCGKTCPAANYYEGRVCHVCYNEELEFYWLWDWAYTKPDWLQLHDWTGC